ncbi:MAG: PilZ domain-containing protein, partial [Phycisphaerae bacterium]
MSATTTRHHGILAAMTRDTATEPGAPVAERRDSRRVCRMISVTLTAADRDKRCPCTLEDICPDGAFVRLPAGFDLMVGQRCEVTFAATVECTDLA